MINSEIISHKAHSPFDYLFTLASELNGNGSEEEDRSGWVSEGTPVETYLERSQLSVEQFLAMLRFENRSKLEELPITLE